MDVSYSSSMLSTLAAASMTVTFLFLSKNCLIIIIIIIATTFILIQEIGFTGSLLEDIHQPKFCATAYDISQTKPVLLQQIVTNCNKFHKYGNKLLNLLSDLITFGCDKLINVSNPAVKSTKNHRLAEHQNISKAKYQMQSSEGVL